MGSGVTPDPIYAARRVVDFPDQPIARIREPAAIDTRIATQFLRIGRSGLPCEISDALPNFLAQFSRELLYLTFEGAVKRQSIRLLSHPAHPARPAVAAVTGSFETPGQQE